MPLDRKYGKVTTELVKNTDGEELWPDPDEPVFIIRAKDRSSIAAIMCYAVGARALGADQSFIDDINASVRRFDAWQKANRSQTKVPD